MLITSLSVPGKHLDCAPRPYGDIYNKLYNAYVIWTGAGMTLQASVSRIISNILLLVGGSRKGCMECTQSWTRVHAAIP